MHFRFRKLTLGLMAGVFVFASLFGALLFPHPAAALPVTGHVTVNVLGDIPKKLEQFKNSLKRKLQIALSNGLVQALKYGMQKIAYDSAVYLAAGGKGQSSFFNNKSFGDYMTSVVQEAGMKGIEEFGKPLGLNLCKIPDLRVDLAFRIGFLDLKFNPYDAVHAPRCSWDQFTRAWSADSWRSQYGSGEAWLNKFNASLDVDQSGLGIMLTASERIDRIVATQQAGAQLSRQEEGEFKAKKTKVSEQKVTPAKVHEETAKSQSPPAQQKQNMEMAGKTLGTELWEIIPGTSRIFLSTLASQIVKNFKEKGMFPFGIPGFCVAGRSLGGADCSETAGGSLADAGGEFSAGPVGGRRAAEAIFSEYLIPKITSVDKYDIISQLSNCPDSPGIDNCAMDEAFAQAVREAEYGDPVTISEAIEKGWLHEDWKLLPPTNALNNDLNCYTQAYCYSNLQKLRKARVVPLGFELAAYNSDPDRPWTLGQVVSGFSSTSTCNFIKDESGRVTGVNYDPVSYPYCRLIDPNWVLKAPPTRCKAMGVGASIIEGTAERVEGCVDMDSCVGYASDGSCASFGYCSREKNVWRFGTEDCDAQFASCRSYTDTATNNRVSYLYRTLDTGFCNQSNVGCRAYSLNKGPTGSWLAPAAPSLTSKYQKNNGIFFNNRLSSECSARSVGCTRFEVASTSLPFGAASDDLLLRKAPDYLGCYDAIPETANSASWPQTRADLLRMNPSSECDNYAEACIPDEMNCNWYTPILASGGQSLGQRIPGRYAPREQVGNEITWNDECPSTCAGYASYREMPSAYSNGRDTSYIIPSSNAACTAADNGCSGFTNLSLLSGDMERVDYFSYLRPCASPDPAKQKTFYTYEGSGDGGYQLKVFVLKEDKDGNSDPAGDGKRAGGPEYFYKTNEELQRFKDQCNREVYQARGNSVGLADCREFNDGQGNVYYRLLSQTVVISGSCTPYRLNDSELYAVSRESIANSKDCADKKGFWDINDTSDNTDDDTCKLCFQNGEYRDGYCIYEGLPSGVSTNAGSSRSCAANSNTCRAFKGNAGNNVRDVFRGALDFEEASTTLATQGWSANGGGTIELSMESTHRDEHSLGYTGSGSARKQQLALNPGMSYELTFWAKGSVGSVTARLINDATIVLGAVNVSDAWNYYRLGPIDLLGKITSTILEFDAASDGRLFLDNIRLLEVQNYIYLVKNRLTVPAECDSLPNDNLPGEMLGCSAYRTPQNNTAYLTNFSYLCRENAIGCTAVYDTQNTFETEADRLGRVYNVWLTRLVGESGATAITSVRGVNYQCVIPAGQNGCYISGFVRAQNLNEVDSALRAKIINSTIFIPTDTPFTTPIYLVANQEAQCREADIGCQYAGAQTMTPNGAVYETTTIKNDPSNYGNILCQSEAVGCAGYSDGSGSFYFKDPQVLGQKVCEYRTNMAVGETKYHGWFWKGVGVCGATTTPVTLPPSPQNCSADTDCAGLTVTIGAMTLPLSCVNRGQQPCYPHYLQAGNVYGLWSYGNTSSYQNFVGECPAEQTGCSEFVDHNDKDRKYYLIDNGNLDDGDCDGAVGSKAGCALFDKTDNPNKIWNTAALYAQSDQYEQTNNRPMPIANARNLGPPDANMLLKVVRDRECGEWLQCRSSHRIWDDKLGKFRHVCDDIGRCNQLPPAFDEESDITNCANWVDTLHEYANQILDPAKYAGRSTLWSGMDYSGISIPNQYPPEELKQVQVNTANAFDSWRLMKEIPCGGAGGTNCVSGNPPSSPKCLRSGQICGPLSNAGLCVSGDCVRSPKGETANILAKSPPQACRSYPETNSPFPNTAEMLRSQVFPAVNYCQEAAAATTSRRATNACDCDYTKVNYGDDLTKYWGYDQPNSLSGVPRRSGSNTTPMRSVPAGVCEDGPFVGYACDPNRGNADCTRGTGDTAVEGTCAAKTKEEKWIGWRGYCLEEDISRVKESKAGTHPCLTWFPVEQLSGARDLNNQHREAGYLGSPEGYGKYYCLGARGNGRAGSTDSSRSVNYNYTASFKYFYFNHEDTTFGFGSSEQLILRSASDVECRVFERRCNANLAYLLTDYQGTDARKNEMSDALTTLDRVNRFETNEGRNSLRQFIGNYDMVRAHNISLDDVDYAKISIISASPNIAGSGGILRGNYFIRNGSRDNLYQQVITDYGGSSSSGEEGAQCKISTDPDKVSTNEVCLQGEKTLVVNSPNITFSEANDRPPSAESRVVTFGNYKIMRFIFDDGDSYDNNVTHPYIDQRLGFFPQYGDKFKKSGEGSATCEPISNGVYECDDGINITEANLNATLTNFCKDGNNKDQDVFEVVVVFDRNTGLLSKVEAAYCSGDENDRDDPLHVDYEVQLNLRELCTAVADTEATGNNIAPWTDRLWSSSPFGRDPVLPNAGPLISGLENFHNAYVTQQSPFGSLRLLANPNYYTGLMTVYAERLNDPRYGSPSPALVIGTPYSCGYGASARPCSGLPLPGGAVDFSKEALGSRRTWPQGFDLLDNLFARVNNIYYYDPTQNTYVVTEDPVGGSREQTRNYNSRLGAGTVDPTPDVPQIRALSHCITEKDQCREAGAGLLVNGRQNGNVVITSKPARSTVKFYAYADENHMPLRQVRVDWGDGRSESNLTGYFRNQRGTAVGACEAPSVGADKKCKLTFPPGETNVTPWFSDISCNIPADCQQVERCVNEEDAVDFGSIKDKTCDNAYFRFDHVYECIPNTSAAWKSGGACSSPDLVRQYGGCCEFTPKAQVKDNWGYCNGTCSDGPAGSACFESECSSAGAWQPFNGKLLVPPIVNVSTEED